MVRKTTKQLLELEQKLQSLTHGFRVPTWNEIQWSSYYYLVITITQWRLQYEISPVPCWVTVLWIRCFCCWGSLITRLPSCCCCRLAVRLPTDCTTDLCVEPRAAAGFLNTLFVAISWGVACDTIKPVTAVEIDDTHNLHTMNIPKKNVYICHLWNIADEMTSEIIDHHQRS